MSNNDMTRDAATSYKETLSELWSHADRDEGYEGENPTDYLEAMPLEIVYEMGEPFAIVLGTGGPHVEITGGGRQGSYKLTVYWAGDVSHVSGWAITRTGEYFRDLYEQSM